MRARKRKRQAALDAMEVATRFVNAANQHDTERLLACVHRDFQSIQPAHPARNFRGVGQLRSNWEAIFRTEPGFRLTVLRSTVAEGGTVWMELHGAGDDAEAAGTFILGVEDSRIRWIRVYSDLVEPAPEPDPVPDLGAPPAAESDLALGDVDEPGTESEATESEEPAPEIGAAGTQDAATEVDDEVGPDADPELPHEDPDPVIADAASAINAAADADGVVESAEQPAKRRRGLFRRSKP